MYLFNPRDTAIAMNASLLFDNSRLTVFLDSHAFYSIIISIDHCYCPILKNQPNLRQSAEESIY